MGDGTAKIEKDVVYIDSEELTGAKTLTDGTKTQAIGSGGKPVMGRQDYTDFGPVHGRGTFVETNEVRHDRLYGNLLFADGHAETFRDTTRDGLFGGQAGAKQGWKTIIYHELENKVYGGWINYNGLNF
jgi:prepilin-type processing-associated H-X9-DG protein